MTTPTSSYLMFWAFKSGVSSGADANVLISSVHDDFGGMSLDLLKDLTAPEVAKKRYNKLIICHGVFMALAWAFCAPLAVVIARLGKGTIKDSYWIQAHRIMQMVFTPLLTVIGFIIAIIETSRHGGGHFTKSHGKMGLILLLSMIAQIICGIWIYTKLDLQRNLRPPRHWGHMISGMAILALALGVVYTGLMVFGMEEWMQMMFGVWVGALALTFAIGYAWIPWQQEKRFGDKELMKKVLGSEDEESQFSCEKESLK